jgi:hypothetical protein
MFIVWHQTESGPLCILSQKSQKNELPWHKITIFSHYITEMASLPTYLIGCFLYQNVDLIKTDLLMAIAE